MYNRDGMYNSYGTSIEQSVQVATQTTGVVSYSEYTAPPPYNPESNIYYHQYNNQQTSGIPQPHVSGNPNVVIISQSVPVKQSFGCHYFWSCITFWFCGMVFGAVAFFLAGKFATDSGLLVQDCHCTRF